MVRKQRRFKTPSPKKLVGAFLLVICLLFVLFPLLLMAAASFMPEDELARRYLAVLELGREAGASALVPDFPSLKPYADLFLRSPGFFVMFWNSCLQVLCVLAGQLLVGMPAAWAFARYDFRFKKRFFLLYLILLVMPFQVMMVPSYLVLDRFRILDTHLAVICLEYSPPFLSISWRNSLNRSRKSFLGGRIDREASGRYSEDWRSDGISQNYDSPASGFFEYWNAGTAADIFKE